MQKKKNIKYIVTFTGLVLILTAMIWISRNLVSPGQLNAQGTTGHALEQPSSSLKLSAPQDSGKSLNSLSEANVEQVKTESLSADKIPAGPSVPSVTPNPKIPPLPEINSTTPSLSAKAPEPTADKGPTPFAPLEIKPIPNERKSEVSLEPAKSASPSFPKVDALPAPNAMTAPNDLTVSNAFPASKNNSEKPVLPSISPARSSSGGTFPALPNSTSSSTVLNPVGSSANSPQTKGDPVPAALPPMATGSNKIPTPVALPPMAAGSNTIPVPSALPPMGAGSNGMPAPMNTGRQISLDQVPEANTSTATVNRQNNSITHNPSSTFVAPSAKNRPGANQLAVASPTVVTKVAPAGKNAANTASAIPMLAGSDTPGDRALEGEQQARVVIMKELPNEVQVGREETFRIRLKNIGERRARSLVLRETLPAGTKLVKTDPELSLSDQKGLIWSGFDLAANEERVFAYTIIPQEEGELGSVATVSFCTEASARTKCTKPELKVEVKAPKEVVLGEEVPLEIVISNVGTGTATDVTVVENVPKGLRHSSGTVLDNRIESIPAGEAKKLTLLLKSAAPGESVNLLTLTSGNGTKQEVKTSIQINAPELQLEINGAVQRFLERESTYTFKVTNPGTAPAKNVTITAKLPDNVKFVGANNYGVYSNDSHSVRWELVELPQNAAPGEIELTVMPNKIGQSRISLEASGNNGLAAESTKDVNVDGISALSYTIKPLTDLVEVGREAVYEVRIVNHGTKSSTNVNLQVLVPDEMKIAGTDGPTKYQLQNGALVFDPIANVGAKQEIVFRIKAICSVPGDHRIKVQVSSDDFERLVKEESIRAYH